jgi:hypothetical protein
LRVEHRDLDAAISALSAADGQDQLQVARLKKRKLRLKGPDRADRGLPDPRHHRLAALPGVYPQVSNRDEFVTVAENRSLELARRSSVGVAVAIATMAQTADLSPTIVEVLYGEALELAGRGARRVRLFGPPDRGER